MVWSGWREDLVLFVAVILVVTFMAGILGSILAGAATRSPVVLMVVLLSLFPWPAEPRWREGNGEGAAAVGLSWWGFVEVGLLLRLPLLMVMATTRGWWLGEVSPPMIVKRLRFRLSSRMDLAVRQRSVSAIEPLLPVGVRRPVLLPLRRCFGGAGGRKRRPWWCLDWRTCGDLFVFLFFSRVLRVLFPGQVAFGLLLGWGCVCEKSCIATLC